MTVVAGAEGFEDPALTNGGEVALSDRESDVDGGALRDAAQPERSLAPLAWSRPPGQAPADRADPSRVSLPMRSAVRDGERPRGLRDRARSRGWSGYFGSPAPTAGANP